jgi:acyl transferase domain-containing protein
MTSLASGAISPTGESRPFDAAANGFVRAEGAVAILLMPVGQCRPRLAAALSGAALRPYGYIVGSGAGADGAKPSAVAPSAVAQQRLMQQVHERAGVDPADVCYMEAHATGTPVGERLWPVLPWLLWMTCISRGANLLFKLCLLLSRSHCTPIQPSNSLQ